MQRRSRSACSTDERGAPSNTSRTSQKITPTQHDATAARHGSASQPASLPLPTRKRSLPIRSRARSDIGPQPSQSSRAGHRTRQQHRAKSRPWSTEKSVVEPPAVHDDDARQDVGPRDHLRFRRGRRGQLLPATPFAACRTGRGCGLRSPAREIGAAPMLRAVRCQDAERCFRRWHRRRQRAEWRGRRNQTAHRRSSAASRRRGSPAAAPPRLSRGCATTE